VEKIYTVIFLFAAIAPVLICLAVYIRTRPVNGGITYSLCLVLAVIGIFRLTYVAVHDPIIGYGNNFDFLRLESCIDLWPKLPPGGDLIANSPAAPIRHYLSLAKYDFPRCMPSTSLAPIILAKAINKAISGWGSNEYLDIRLVGIARVVITFAIIFISINIIFQSNKWLALAMAGAFAIVMSDPMSSLWLNTLYTEYELIVFAFVAVFLTAHLESVRTL
jgi:hypothetical protein